MTNCAAQYLSIVYWESLCVAMEVVTEEVSPGEVHAAFARRAQDNYRSLLATRNRKELSAMVEAQNRLLRPPPPSGYVSYDELLRLGQEEYSRRHAISNAKWRGQQPPVESPVDAATAKLRIMAYRAYINLKAYDYYKCPDPIIAAERLDRKKRLQRQSYHRKMELAEASQNAIDQRLYEDENSEEQALSYAAAIRQAAGKDRLQEAAGFFPQPPP